MGYRVSVIIPVYNCENFINRAVESVINQPDSEQIQIILVDDGSKDSSGKICDELAQNYQNISVFHQKNAGVSAARNTGIDHAEGEWLCFLDCDDYLLEGFFKKLLSDPCADLLCCDFDIHDNSFPLIGERINEGVYFKKDFNTVLYPMMSENTVFYSACNKLFKTDIVRENNLSFVVGMRYAEDMTFVFEYVKHIESFKFVNEKLYHYYGNENSATSVVAKTYETYRTIYLYKSEYFKEISAADSLKGQILVNFLNLSMGAIFTAINNLNVLEAFFYVRKIVKDSLFSENYRSNRIFRCCPDGVYKHMEPYLYKGNAAAVFALAKFSQMRVKYLDRKSEVQNNG